MSEAVKTVENLICFTLEVEQINKFEIKYCFMTLYHIIIQKLKAPKKLNKPSKNQGTFFQSCLKVNLSDGKKLKWIRCAWLYTVSARFPKFWQINLRLKMLILWPLTYIAIFASDFHKISYFHTFLILFFIHIFLAHCCDIRRCWII